jgi:hypothetical protein
MVMAEEQTHKAMESKIKQLEREVLEYVRREKEFNKKQKLVEYGYMRRTISLMKIIDELNREIKTLKRAGKAEMRLVSGNLEERLKELNSLYDISSLKSAVNFSLDHILQAVVDFIPPAMQFPEIACARILFDHYCFKTQNFIDTRWKLSQKILVNHEKIGILEVCYLEKRPEIENTPFLKETKNLVAAIAESIAQIIEREWAEVEIQKGRAKIEALIKGTSC